jgi:hypothetical protein
MKEEELQSWIQRQEALKQLAQRQLFFVGGAPRSGTTWLQHLLDSHPNVSCRGEGLLMQHVAAPLDRMIGQWRQEIEIKNANLFRQIGGYPLPQQDDADLLFGTAVLLALERQSAGKTCSAIGEKTPENVFVFPRIKRAFPRAKFIGIVRDPRDVLTSAWHFFKKPAAVDDPDSKLAFVRNALPSLKHGAHAMIRLKECYPSDCMIVTYERMCEAPAPTARHLFRFLDVPDNDDLIADCVARTSFAALSGGRAPGTLETMSFFRKGIVGDWRSTLTAEMNEMILRELGWMFSDFGWTP